MKTVAANWSIEKRTARTPRAVIPPKRPTVHDRCLGVSGEVRQGIFGMTDATRSITNALSIDLEDWGQSTLGPDMPITSRVVRNTERLLALLDRHGTRATFFALGKVCDRFPGLLNTVASAGHEIGTHGYGHELVHSLSPRQFGEDLERSIDVIANQIGRRPIGYRAPAFSVTRHTAWVGPILAGRGIRYSSSVFPIAGKRYGIPNAPRFPFRWPNCDLIEFPMTTVRRWGRNLPVCGGGYFRLLPRPVLSAALRDINRDRRPAVVYLHPYELDVNEPAILQKNGWPIGWRTYIRQSLFRGRIAGRLRAILREFRFAPIAEVLGLMPSQPSAETSALTRSMPRPSVMMESSRQARTFDKDPARV